MQKFSEKNMKHSLLRAALAAVTTLALTIAVGQGPADWLEPFPAH